MIVVNQLVCVYWRESCTSLFALYSSDVLLLIWSLWQRIHTMENLASLLKDGHSALSRAMADDSLEEEVEGKIAPVLLLLLLLLLSSSSFHPSSCLYLRQQS